VSFTAKFCSWTSAAEDCLLLWPATGAKQQHGQLDWRQEQAVALAIPSLQSHIMENNCPLGKEKN